MNKVALIKPEEARNWSVRHGAIRHDTNRFFSIINVNGRAFLDQPEIGCIGWIYAAENDSFLALNKFEPGNVNPVMVTSTVQVTRSNMDRVHGGKAVPMLQLMDMPAMILGSECGNMFLHKVNRNGVKIGHAYYDKIASPHHFWIKSEELLHAITQDQQVTADARSALVCSNWLLWYPKGDQLFWEHIYDDEVIDRPRHIYITCDHVLKQPIERIDQMGDQLKWIRVETDTREVEGWDQPILNGENREDDVVELWVDLRQNQLMVGLLPVWEPGLREVQMGPSRKHETHMEELISCTSCEEGGRIWKGNTKYRLCRGDMDDDPRLVWYTLSALQALCLRNLSMTSEARCAVALLLAWMMKEKP